MCIQLDDKVPFRIHWPMHANLSFETLNGSMISSIRVHQRLASAKLGINQRDEGYDLRQLLPASGGTNQAGMAETVHVVGCSGIRHVVVSFGSCGASPGMCVQRLAAVVPGRTTCQQLVHRSACSMCHVVCQSVCRYCQQGRISLLDHIWSATDTLIYDRVLFRICSTSLLVLFIKAVICASC
eukprot:GHUV01038704.1.p1 GENE.GHUV01038704.1~~GHUV01038704.1.p1  ORF type:complete len:183 (-),score=26.98 GHUV01038704.1:541-1089(-)